MTFPIASGADWSFDDLYRIYDEIEIIAKEMGMDNIFPNQVEIITSEQMIDAYSSIGLPIMYNHWSFGKSFVRTKQAYKKGMQGLAYEIVINSNPCNVYCMETNTLLMQALVMAHAGIGHNWFFKNNYLFKEWTDPEGIIDYLNYSKKFIAKCEEKHGVHRVERILDAAHALMNVSVFRYPQKEPLSLKKELKKQIDRAVLAEQNYNDLWRTLPRSKKLKEVDTDLLRRKEKLQLPEDNILYFIETYSPSLHGWEREILRIVRNIAQYFYPQGQDKVGNEGCATYTHYTILNRMYDKGLISDGAMIEFLKSHNNVVMQPDFDSPYYSGLNPYALGFAIAKDIERICHDPTDEDKKWFPSFAGNKNHMDVLKDSWSNYRDETLIRQFLSPTVIRKFKLFSLVTSQMEDNYTVQNIHNERGYKKIRSLLGDEYSLENELPQVYVADVDLDGERELELEFKTTKNRRLETTDKLLTLKHVANLWGYPVRLTTINENGGSEERSYVKPDAMIEAERREMEYNMDICY